LVKEILKYIKDNNVKSTKVAKTPTVKSVHKKKVSAVAVRDSDNEESEEEEEEEEEEEKKKG